MNAPETRNDNYMERIFLGHVESVANAMVVSNMNGDRDQISIQNAKDAYERAILASLIARFPKTAQQIISAR